MSENTPDGWQLVPKMLDANMLEVAQLVADGPLVSFQDHWDQMLIAAPKGESSLTRKNAELKAREAALIKALEEALEWVSNVAENAFNAREYYRTEAKENELDRARLQREADDHHAKYRVWTERAAIIGSVLKSNGGAT